MGNIGIRWRLTLAYGVILTSVLAGLALFLYRQQESFLIDNTASRVRSQTAIALGQLPVDEPLSDARDAEDTLKLALSGPDTRVALLDAEGTSLLAGGSGTVAPLDVEDYVAAASGSLKRVHDAADGDGRAVSVLVPVRDGNDDLVGVVQVDASLDSVDASLDRLLVLLTIGVVAAHVFGLALIFAVTSWSLSPLNRIVDVCRAIGRGSFGERSRLPKGPDELGELGRAFDAMIEEVQATVGQREQSEQLTRQFAADASHELKSPLTVISGYIDVLLRGGADDAEQLQRALAGMQRETDRMSRLVTDLLALAQLEGGSKTMRREELRLSRLLKDEIEDARLRSSAHEFRLDLDGDARVLADADALRQALRNLIDNAVRHTEAGGAITLELTSDRTAAVISVVDNGPGIAPEHLSRIFDRFYRAEASRSRSDGQAGLGLAITRALVEANGGGIRAESRDGEGARFTIRLPLAMPSASELDSAAALRKL